jgi:glycosyltransferase involved in cell wall biosynthesis
LLFVDDFMLPRRLRDADAPVGGWSGQLAILAENLSQSGHDVGVLAWKGANAQAGQQKICRLLETFDPARGVPFLRFFHPRLTSLASETARYKPDVIVQSCSGLMTGVMAWIARRQHIPFVHRIACDTDADGREHLYLGRAERMAFRYGLRHTALIICQNAYQQQHIATLLPHKPTAVLHNATALSPSTAPLSRADRHYVAWLAVFRRQKNLTLLLRVAQDNPAVEFRVAGEAYGRLDAESASAVEGLRRLANVRLMGYLRHNAVAAFLEGAICLLSTSDYEGFSNTFLESLGVGTPIVARSSIDPDGMIARNGLGFVAADKAGLNNALRQACSLDRRSFQAMSLRCAQYVSARHSPLDARTALLQMLDPLVSPHMRDSGDG